ncbi:MAG: glutaredoxin 3 [Hyphomicrobiaceae bacterium]
MLPVTIYTTQFCGYCRRAKQLLQRKGVAYSEIDVTFDRDLYREMADRAGRSTVPQIWIGQTHIGGCDELYALERQGELDKMLSAEAEESEGE